MEPFRYHVFVCMQEKPEGVTCCSASGSARVLEALHREVGKQGLSKEVQITACGCMGLCDDGPVVIEGLWALAFGNGGRGGNPDTLYFTAGPNGEMNGLFGSLTAVPEPSTWAMMLAGFVGLGFVGYRRARRTGATAASA